MKDVLKVDLIRELPPRLPGEYFVYYIPPERVADLIAGLARIVNLPREPFVVVETQLPVARTDRGRMACLWLMVPLQSSQDPRNGDHFVQAEIREVQKAEMSLGPAG